MGMGGGGKGRGSAMRGTIMLLYNLQLFDDCNA